ncbi:MAG: hypothetical protein J07HQW2_02330 [Haloquadratum walsbyi J07HQW2]|uniref:Uncharacterized protein n=1 Tax=Haloquadratum walsbyi J07HQW2 TaxID=1238425 RepID=U1NFM2_9EURY|nr:MAG: hypothetical protein J07HQW2_02330 [Haloquadratum walsbyi J07HQW2]
MYHNSCLLTVFSEHTAKYIHYFVTCIPRINHNDIDMHNVIIDLLILPLIDNQ